MITIDTLMRQRAALTAANEAIQPDQSIVEVFARRWAVEDTILSCTATTLDALKHQIRILAERAHDGADVSLDLERLAD